LERFSKPLVTGPNPILISYSGERDADSEEAMARPEGKRKSGLGDCNRRTRGWRWFIRTRRALMWAKPYLREKWKAKVEVKS
jgi:hypothetical protein